MKGEEEEEKKANVKVEKVTKCHDKELLHKMIN